jgi:thioredoxin-like negative regulator of GroEL
VERRQDPEAGRIVEAAVAANPNHAEAHYQLGMALVNVGNPAAATEFEIYLKPQQAGPTRPQPRELSAR